VQLRDAELYSLAQRVRVKGADDWNDEWRCHVVLRMKDGRSFVGDEQMVDKSIFYPDRNGVTSKFKAMVSETPFAPRAEAICAAVFALDAANGVGGLTALLAEA